MAAPLSCEHMNFLFDHVTGTNFSRNSALISGIGLGMLDMNAILYLEMASASIVVILGGSRSVMPSRYRLDVNKGIGKSYFMLPYLDLDLRPVEKIYRLGD